MKKYVNGEYVEMTVEELREWEKAQKEIEKFDWGGVMNLVESYVAEEGGTTFDIPVGKQYKDVLLHITLSLTASAALKVSFDDKEVLFVTSGSYLTGSNVLQLFAHNIGGYIDGGIKKISYGTQISTLYTFNSMLTKGMPEMIRLTVYTANSTSVIKGGKAEVYARE